MLKIVCARKYDPVPEFIVPVFAKTSPKRSFSVIEHDRFGLVFTKTGTINSGTGGPSRIRFFLLIPDPGVKKVPDPGSATLVPY
jgi:hypothetical protein